MTKDRGNEGLTPDQERLLRDEWKIEKASRAGSGKTPIPSNDFFWRQEERRWHDQLLAHEVTFHRNGRATIVPPGEPFVVEVRFAPGKTRDVMTLAEVTIRPDADAGFNARRTGPVLDRCLVALHLRAIGGMPETFTRVPRTRPKPGQPLDDDFYERLLDAYNALLLVEKHPSPAQELARRMNANPSTVRTWIRKAKDSAREGGSE